jgi:GT2 family glycosyltransferase
MRIFCDYLFANTKNFKLYVSDSGSTDKTVEYLSKLKEKYPNTVTYRHTEDNSGWTKGINWGISQGSGEYVLIANCDLALPEQWFEKMSAHFKEGVGAVGPISDMVSGRQAMAYSYGQSEDEVNLLIGFCILTKREVLDKVGLMDEEFTYDHDDYDLSYRIRKDYRLIIARDVFVKHFFCNTLSGRYAKEGLVQKGADLFISKHGQEAYHKTRAIKTTVVIGIPFHGDVDHEFISSILSINKPGGNGAVVFAKTVRTLISPARNLLAQAALDYDSQFLLFVDSDMVFESQCLMRLMQRACDPNISIIGGLALKRNAPFEPCIMNRKKGKWKYCQIPEVPGLYEVDAIGMAFTLIKTKVFKDLKKPYFYPDKEGLREDLNFCWNAKKAGHRVFVDTTVQVGHLGERVMVDWHLKKMNDEIKNGTFIS